MLKRMAEEGRDCSEILIQISGVCKLFCVKLKNNTRWVYEDFVTRNAIAHIVFLVFALIAFLYMKLENK